MQQTSTDLPDTLPPASSSQSLQRIFRGGGGPLFTRLIGLGLFLAFLVVFRELALIGVVFVVLAHGLGFLGQRVALLLKTSERRGALVVILCLALLLGLGVWLLIHFGGKKVQLFLGQHNAQTLTARFQQLHDDLLSRLPEWMPLEGIKERVPHMVQPAVDYLKATGRTVMYVLIGLILAVIYVLDREPVDALVNDARPDTIFGAIRRYFHYLGEAILITITLQVLVALVNTALTLPVLLILGLKHIVTLTLLIFLSSLVPVVGNLVSGAVLIATAYFEKGLWAAAFFIATTFVLHKIEAYYLNPRLASRHVNLPSLILIVSLILHEHVFGIVGLFLSFPVLYVGLNVIRDLRQAIDGMRPSASAPPSQK